MGDWSRKSEWKMQSKTFIVVVSRHLSLTDREELGEKANLWAVYAYIYPDHELFSTFIPDGDMWQDAASALPLHKGPSLFKAHRSADHGSVISYQIGADYDHLHDEEFWIIDDDGFDGSKMKRDAEELFEFLEPIS